MPNSGVSKPKIVFFGNEQIATGVTTEAPVLQMLIDEGYDVVMVVTNHRVSTSRTSKSLAVQQIASRHDIAFHTPTSLQEIRDNIATSGAMLGVLVAFGQMVPENIIRLFPLGIINIHPSALPKHRGPTPLESVLLSGESTTCVSLMQLARKMDAGPVYAQSELIPVDTHITKQQLADRLLATGVAMLRAILPLITNGECTAIPQEDTTATYDTMLNKSAGLMDFAKSAVQLEREVRAYAGWPKSRMTIGGIEVVVTEARVVNEDEFIETKVPNGNIFAVRNRLYVQTGDGLLGIEKLKPAGKKEMSAAAFIAGYSSRLNAKKEK